MTQFTAPTVDAAYRARIADLKARVQALIRGAFREELDVEDIKGTFDAFASRAADLIATGQATAQELALSYVTDLAETVTLEGDPYEPLPPDEEAVGITAKGLDLEASLGAIAPLMLAAIADGRPPEEALAYGESLAAGQGDAEVAAAADTEAERQIEHAGPRISGWQGIVSPDACERCQVNQGFHDRSEQIYRHPNCDCERTWVLFSDQDPTAPAREIQGDVIDDVVGFLVEGATAAEPAVTRDLQALADLLGGNLDTPFELNGKILTTLMARLKTEASTIKKLTGDLILNGGDPQAAAQALYDNLRYTMTTVNADDLPALVRGTTERLSDLGYVPMRIKNFWALSDKGYAGYNAVFQNPDGQMFELQFHTPQTLQVKEGDTHHFYEIQKTAPRGSVEWQEAEDAINELWAGIRKDHPEAGLDFDWAKSEYQKAQP